MTSRKSSSLNYQSLARESARIERIFDVAAFTRFAELECDLVGPDLKVSFQFSLLRDRAMVSTHTDVKVNAGCQWCMEVQPVILAIDASTLLASDDEQAAAWTADEMQRPASEAALSVVVANEIDIDLLDWFEDELLLAWPVPVCTDVGCAKRPGASYGDSDSAPEEISGSRQAFAELARLKETLPDSE